MASRTMMVDKKVNIKNFKEGQNFSPQLKVIKKADNYIVVGRTFRNGNPKKMSLKYIFQA